MGYHVVDDRCGACGLEDAAGDNATLIYDLFLELLVLEHIEESYDEFVIF